MRREIKDNCNSSYTYYYISLSDNLANEAIARSRSGSISDSRQREIETEAQKAAIKKSLFDMLSNYPEEDASELWRCLYEAHVHRKSGIDDPDTIARVISADQSWKKSSGHAFEEFIKETGTEALSGTGVEFILQRDLSVLIEGNELANQQRDVDWLKHQTAASVFDLYALVEHNGAKYCFGCIQSKTSIRDRVTRDREPSMQAMDHFFWSIAITLDGAFLRMPKFVGMVNGGTDEYASNGWHGMYVLSRISSEGRIYHTDIAFGILREHAQLAADYWLNQRQWFNRNWLPGQQ